MRRAASAVDTAGMATDRGGTGAAAGAGATTATVAFVDLCGFSALTDVYGDDAAVGVLERFEALVDEALEHHGPPVKWIGDAARLAVADPDAARRVLGRLLAACRDEPAIPLTRTGLHHGRVIRRRGDLVGATVNTAARITALAFPGQVLATDGPAASAGVLGLGVRSLGEVALRSMAEPVELHEIELAPPAQPAWIDPVCKMHAPLRHEQGDTGEPWFCSPRCAEAYERSPETYR